MKLVLFTAFARDSFWLVLWSAGLLVLPPALAAPGPAVADAHDQTSGGESDKLTEAEQAWKAFLKANQAPPPPAEWRTRKPTPNEKAEWDKGNGVLAGKAADLAKDFYTRFPNHAKSAEARKYEVRLLQIAVQFGNTNRVEQLAALNQDQVKTSVSSDDEQFEARYEEIRRAALLKEGQGIPIMYAEYEKGLRQLQKEFPTRMEIYQMLLDVAVHSETKKAAALAQEILDSSAPERLKVLAKRHTLVGQPLPIKFTAVDDRQIDLAKMKGQVVLLDFWATWCGACLAEVPNVKAAYQKWHPKGFEILGLSCDEDKSVLTRFMARENITWPQYFEAGGENNRFAVEYGALLLPTMWLVDKQGNLRDLEAREDLAGKVEKLLAE